VWHTFAVSTAGARHAVVVGSGLAGLTCATELARAGWRVTVVTPGRPGCDGATHRVHGLAPWILLTAPCVRGDSPARYLADLQRHGDGLGRPGLDEVFAEASHRAVESLRETLCLEPMDGGPILLPGDEIPRGNRLLPRRHGPLLAPLVRVCGEAGVTFLPRRIVAALLRGEGRVTGVLTVERARGAEERVAADAVVLACGGAGAVFPCTTSPRWCRGSGVALALGAGALLHRPHLTQALPVTATPPLFFPTSAAIVSGRLVSAGVELPRFRDLAEATEAIAHALRSGAGVELLVPPQHASVLPRTLLEEACSHGAVPLTLALHHTLGGVAIDAWGRTSMPALYACGEAAGGVQGARRTMGTGLLEAHIFGARVAQAVAADAHSRAVGREAGEAVPPAVPRDPAALEARLDSRLEPLVAVRPVAEVTAALQELERWPEEHAPASIAPAAALTSLRWAAARAMLEAQATAHGNRTAPAG
jgi:L-aspartate oxidase